MNNQTNNEEMESTAVVFRPNSDVVASTVAELRGQLKDRILPNTREVTIDLSDVRMVDSSGLGMLIATHNSLRKTGGELVLDGCSADLLELFRAMRIHQHMKVKGA